MRDYANAEDKRVALMIATMETWAQDLIEKPPRNLNKATYKRRLLHMLNHLSKLTAAAVSDLAEDAKQALYEHIATQDVLIVPKDKVKSSPMYVVVKADDFEYLASRIDDCWCCNKSPAEVRGCQIRKAMLRCGAIPTGTRRDDCPFMP